MINKSQRYHYYYFSQQADPPMAESKLKFMKKYLGLFIVIAMAFVINTSQVKAIEDKEEESVKNEVTIQGTGEAVVDYEDSEEKIDDKEGEIRLFKIEAEKIKEGIKQLREEAKSKMEALKEKIKEEKNKSKAKIKEERISGREQALERFDEAVKRMDDLKAKVIDQVAKMEAKNTIIPKEVKDLSILTESKLTAAKAKIVEVNNILASSINELSKENKTKLVTLSQEIQTLIKEAHQTLNDEIIGLRQILKIKTEAIKIENK